MKETARLEEADRRERKAEIGAAAVAAACRVCKGDGVVSCFSHVKEDVEGRNMMGAGAGAGHIYESFHPRPSEHSPETSSLTRWLVLLVLVLVLVLALLFAMRPAAVLTLIHRGGDGVLFAAISYQCDHCYRQIG